MGEILSVGSQKGDLVTLTETNFVLRREENEDLVIYQITNLKPLCKRNNSNTDK